jgi:ATP-binding cassette, subfamily B, bacterial PglK
LHYLCVHTPKPKINVDKPKVFARMPSSKISLVGLSIQTFRLLNQTQRVEIGKNFVFSVVLAALEVFSLTAVLPLFYFFLNNTDTGRQTKFDTFVKIIEPLTSSLSWPAMLTAIVLIFLIKNILSIWLAQYQSKFLNDLYINFSTLFYENFYRQSWTIFLQKNASEMFRKIKNTPYDFTHYVLQGYLFLITDVFICTLMIITMAWINIKILFVLLALSVPVFLIYYFLRKKVIKKIDQSFRELTPQANIFLAQGIDSFAEAKIYRKQYFFINHFIQTIRITSSQLSKLQSFANLPSRIIEVLGILCFASAVIYAKLFPIYTPEVLVALALLSVAMYRIVPSVNRILLCISQIQAYSYSISELQSETALQTDEAKPHQMLRFEKAIQFKNVSFQYGGNTSKPLIHQLSFTINKGDFILLEGASGAGKSTLVHIMAGLISDYSGEILVDDVLLSPACLSSWHQNIGLVPQAPVILQDTLIKNIAFGEDTLKSNKQLAEHALQLAGLDSFVRQLPLQLETPIGENGLTLSGGQRQRLNLARALYRNPNLLLLDEVTNQLDELNKSKILHSLKKLTEEGATIIFASHDPIVKRFATRILHVAETTIVERPVNSSVLA